MSILPISTGHVRNTGGRPHVQRTMSPLSMAVPLLRALILAVLATALIMVGLPAVLAIASAAAL
jgi:hypothetical protein